jgi:signal transduction histidine kinase
MYLRGLMSDVENRQMSLDLSRRQLSDANKLASVGKLAASVAHEIRNPLTAIRMWLFAIQKEVGGEESVDRKFKVVSEELTRLERIVRDFLDFARPPQLQRVSCSISETLDTTLELLRPRLADERIEVVRCDEPGLPRVNADAEQLKQVLLNLIGNARDAVAGGGRIHLSASSETEPDGRKTVTVRISDTGTGIRPDVQARIFEPFFSTKERGTGLGLCIAARIVAGHEGRLVLESSSERGTTFALHVPAFQVTPT